MEQKRSRRAPSTSSILGRSGDTQTEKKGQLLWKIENNWRRFTDTRELAKIFSDILDVIKRFQYPHFAKYFHSTSAIHLGNLDLKDFTREINGLVTRKATGWIESVRANGQELRGNTHM